MVWALHPYWKRVCIPNGFILDEQNTQKEGVYFLYRNNNFRIVLNMDYHEAPQNEVLLSKSFEIKNRWC